MRKIYIKSTSADAGMHRAITGIRGVVHNLPFRGSV
jgi:hypothetical protein